MNNLEDLTRESVDSEESFKIQDYWQVIWKWKWVIFTVFLVVVITVTTRTYKQKPLYLTAGRILIETDQPNLISLEQIWNYDASSYAYFETQFEIIKSRSIIGKVIQKLDLKNSPEFTSNKESDSKINIGSVKKWVVNWTAALVDKFQSEDKLIKNQTLSLKDLDTESRENELFYQLVSQRIEVALVGDSQLVDIRMVGHNPAIITEIINTLIKIYIEQNLENRLFASEGAVEWLDSRLKAMQEKVESSDKALQDYSKTVGAVSLDSKRSLVDKDIADLNAQITVARKKRITLQTLYENSQNPDVAYSLPEIVTNSLIQELNHELANLNLKGSEMKKKYGPKHPKLIQLSSQIEKITEAIEVEVGKIHESIHTELKLAMAAEESLTKPLKEKQKEAVFLNEKSIRYGVLKREAESNRQMFDLLLQRLKETDLSSGLRNNNIRLVDPAVAPLAPFKPDKQRNLMFGVIFGLLGGVGLAFFIEFLDNSVKDPDEIVSRFGIPFLGLVGSHSSEDRSKSISLADKLITLKEPSSSISESLRTIRTNVIFSADGDKKKTLMISSALPAEGKTTVSSNLAVVMASLGEKVLLIDADLRRPSIHRTFNVTKSPGLSSYLINQNSMDEIIYKTEVDNLFVIPSGIVPPNPSELLSHDQLKVLLGEAIKNYNRVIIDTPPIASVADPMIISKTVDAAILIIRSRETARDVVMRAVKQLKNVNANIMGAILNHVDFRKDSYYYQYYYKHYYYKEDSKKESVA